jgi:hypothetical protein
MGSQLAAEGRSAIFLSPLILDCQGKMYWAATICTDHVKMKKYYIKSGKKGASYMQ